MDCWLAFLLRWAWLLLGRRGSRCPDDKVNASELGGRSCLGIVRSCSGSCRLPVAGCQFGGCFQLTTCNLQLTTHMMAGMIRTLVSLFLFSSTALAQMQVAPLTRNGQTIIIEPYAPNVV